MKTYLVTALIALGVVYLTNNVAFVRDLVGPKA